MSYDVSAYRYTLMAPELISTYKTGMAEVIKDPAIPYLKTTYTAIDSEAQLVLYNPEGHENVVTYLSRAQAMSIASGYLSRCGQRLADAITRNRLPKEFQPCFNCKPVDGVPVFDIQNPDLIRYYQCFFEFSWPSMVVRQTDFGFSNTIKGSPNAVVDRQTIRGDVTGLSSIICLSIKLMPIINKKRYNISDFVVIDNRIPDTKLFLDDSQNIVRPFIIDSVYGFKDPISKEALLNGAFSDSQPNFRSAIPLQEASKDDKASSALT